MNVMEQPCQPEYAPVQKKASKQEYEEAQIKAMILLKESIGEGKFMCLVGIGYFSVTGKYGKYDIPMSGNVKLHTEAKIGEKTRPLTWFLCAGVEQTNLPTGDYILARYLAITGDEDNFIKTANFRSVETEDEYMESVPRDGEGVCETRELPPLPQNIGSNRGISI